MTVYGDPLDSKVLKEMQEEIAASLTRGRAGFFDPSLRPMAESGRGRLSK
ncbi:hypothetical protein [Trichloromonas acetexigens]|nr:hypothetical protein [Desulfuromonas acetexigens]